MHKLDEYDKAILRLLQQNNRLTNEQLSNEINLSQSAIQRRIARFRKQKIIEADVSIISPSVLGIGITAIVDVVLREGSSTFIEKFKNSMRDCSEVSQCYYVTGTYDFVLVVNTKDMKHFEEFSKTHLMDNPNLKHFYTHVVIDNVTFSYGVEL